MAVGKPIIMGVNGDASDLISRADCGLCFESENPVALAEAVKHLMLLSPSDKEKFRKCSQVL